LTDIASYMRFLSPLIRLELITRKRPTVRLCQSIPTLKLHIYILTHQLSYLAHRSQRLCVCRRQGAICRVAQKVSHYQELS